MVQLIKKSLVFWFKFNRILFLQVKLAINQYMVKSDGLALNGQQDISWNTDDQDPQCNMTSLGYNELNPDMLYQ